MEHPKGKVEPDPNKEPIFTGHKSQADFLEDLRIGAASKGFGHGIGLFLQVAVYLALVATLVGVLWWLFAR
jgi:hypothetical protein